VINIQTHRGELLSISREGGVDDSVAMEASAKDLRQRKKRESNFSEKWMALVTVLHTISRGTSADSPVATNSPS
jgi:hypothetical protein